MRFGRAALAVLAAMLPWTVVADEFPETSVAAMCDQVELIVEGEYLGKNRVRISRVHKGSKRLARAAAGIEVADLDKHDRVLRAGWERRGAAVATKKLVLFLSYDAKAKVWRSLHTIDTDGHCGSCGLFWYDRARCYGYLQAMNPGPYVLCRGDGERWQPRRIPKDIDALRLDIVAGLENSRRWRAALAIRDPRQRAEALGKYFLARTSPEGDYGVYRYAVRERMRELGADAVVVLVGLLRTAEAGDDLNGVVLTLYDIGPAAKAAVPLLCDLLGSPKQAHTGYVLSALRTIGDRGAVGSVRPVLGHDRLHVAVEAAQTLAALGDVESFDKIASLVPEEPQKGYCYTLRDLLNALHALDPERAAPIIRGLAAHPRMAPVRGQIRGVQ